MRAEVASLKNALTVLREIPPESSMMVGDLWILLLCPDINLLTVCWTVFLPSNKACERVFVYNHRHRQIGPPSNRWNLDSQYSMGLLGRFLYIGRLDSLGSFSSRWGLNYQ